MPITDRIPTLSDAELRTLRDNAERLATTGKPKQASAATAVLPAISAELEVRKARHKAMLAEARAERVRRARSPAIGESRGAVDAPPPPTESPGTSPVPSDKIH
jgi:hypothetical protein